jgi:Fic family protein
MTTLESIQQELISTRNELSLTNKKMDLLLKRFMPDSELISSSEAVDLLGVSKTAIQKILKDHPEFTCKQIKGHKRIYRKMIEDYWKLK